MAYETLYHLRYNAGEWIEVTMEDYVKAERAAGFHNTLGEPDQPATVMFNGKDGPHTVQGKTTYRPVEE